MPDQPVLVAITGITGYIGAHLALLLLQHGYRVRGTLRKPGRSASLRKTLDHHLGRPTGDQLEFVQADLLREDSWERALDGCALVHHIASPVPLKIPRDPMQVIGPAREGTLHVLRAAQKGGARRVVITSSIAAVAYGRKAAPGHTYNETDWTDPDGNGLTPYIKAKTLAEKAAWAFREAQAPELELVTLQPGLVLGPLLEADFSPSLESIRQMLAGKWRLTPRISYPVVDVRDVAHLHLLAMRHPKAGGERFVCAGPTLSFADMASILSDAFPEMADRLPRGRLPSWIFRMIAPFNRGAAMVLPELDRPIRLSSRKAIEQLGWEMRPPEETVISSARSLLEFGQVS